MGTFGIYYEIMPAFAFVIFFTLSRTSLAAVGHYHCHRRKDGYADWGYSLFDMNYVGASLVLSDGHVMLHHLYTNAGGDVKVKIFGGITTIPRLWRIPLHTFQRFGQFLTGTLLRFLGIALADPKFRDNRIWVLEFAAVRSLLLFEFIFCF